MKKKKGGIKIVYKYIEPKTKEEREEAERRLARAYDIIFTQVFLPWRKKKIAEGHPSKDGRLMLPTERQEQKKAAKK